jgi:hypothetical protein
VPADRDSLQDFVAFIVVGGTFNATVLSMRVAGSGLPLPWRPIVASKFTQVTVQILDKRGALWSDRGSC